MKLIFSLVLTICLTVLCNSCQQNKNPDSASGIIASNSSNEGVSINTADCKQLIAASAYGGDKWEHRWANFFTLTTALKPKALIMVRKIPSLYNDSTFQFSVYVKIDSSRCIEQNNTITLNFVDNTSTILKNKSDNNCKGILDATLEISDGRNNDDVKKLIGTNINSIKVQTHDGDIDYKLTDIEGINLRQLFTCLYSAK